MKEQERICRELGNKADLQRSLGNQALILYARGDLDGAMELWKEQERICRELGKPDDLARSLANQALILDKKGLHSEAITQAEEAYQLAVRHGYTTLAQQIQQVLDGLTK